MTSARRHLHTLLTWLVAILIAAFPPFCANMGPAAFADEAAESGTSADPGTGGGEDDSGNSPESPDPSGGAEPPGQPASSGESPDPSQEADPAAGGATQAGQTDPAGEQPTQADASRNPEPEAPKGGFKLSVIDAETYALDGSGAPQGDAGFAGMAFDIIGEDGKTAATVSADASGAVLLPAADGIPLGTYYVRQDEAAAGRLGYRPDARWTGAGWKVVISSPGEIVDAGFCSCEPVRGSVQLALADADLYRAAGLAGTPQGRCSFSGAAYEVYNGSAHAVIVGGKAFAPYVEGSDANQPICVLRATNRGTASTRATGRGASTLPWGTYVFVQKHAPKGYRATAGVAGSAAVRGEGRFAPKAPVLLEASRGGLSLAARDAQTADGKPQGDADFEGIAFEVLNANPKALGDGATVVVDGKPYKRGEVVMELSADAQGHAETPSDALPIGTYRIRMAKLSTSLSYRQDPSWTAWVTVRGGDGPETPDGKSQPAVEPVCGGVTVRVLDAESKKLLSGSVLEVVNESERPVVTGGLQHAKGEVVARIAPSEGKAESGADALPYGSYSIREAQASAGHEPDASWSVAFKVRREGQVVDAGRLFEPATGKAAGSRDEDMQALLGILMPTVPIAVACAAAVGIVAIVITQRQIARREDPSE